MSTTVDDTFLPGWPLLRLAFEEAPQKLTREDILAEWPADHTKPNAFTLWRSLGRGVQVGQIACEGAGHPEVHCTAKRDEQIAKGVGRRYCDYAICLIRFPLLISPCMHTSG